MTTPLDASVAVLAIIFRAYLADQSMEHLAAALRRGNIKDLLLFFPLNRRDAKVLDDFFRKEGLPQVAEWYTKKQYALAKEGIVAELKGLSGHGESAEVVRAYWLVGRYGTADRVAGQIISAIQKKLEEHSLPDTELIQCIWQGLMASVDWSARPDQIEGHALREVGVRAISTPQSSPPADCLTPDRNSPLFLRHSPKDPRSRLP